MSSDDRLIAARYVEALFDLATKENVHDEVKADFTTLKSVVAGSDELRKLLGSPVITRENAEKAILTVLAAIKASELTRKFFALLARNRRLALSNLTIEGYLERLAESRGEIAVEVTSARKLGEDEIATLSASISKSTGRKVAIHATENPALLGGLQVRVGSRLLDNSVAGKLDRLKQVLSHAA